MGERGPVAKTKSMENLTGNPGRRHHKKAKKTESKGLQCPEWLANDAKSFWEKIVPELQAKKALTDTDYLSLVSLCIAWSEVKRYHEYTASGKSPFYKAPGGQIIPHPAIGLLRQAQTRLDSIMKQFGLSPASRARIPVMLEADDPSEVKDSFQEFLDG